MCATYWNHLQKVEMETPQQDIVMCGPIKMLTRIDEYEAGRGQFKGRDVLEDECKSPCRPIDMNSGTYGCSA